MPFKSESNDLKGIVTSKGIHCYLKRYFYLLFLDIIDLIY